MTREADPFPDSAAWPAPAKLNLMLRVLGRRPDGYHRLQTVFQLLDRVDRIWLDLRRDGEVRRHTPLAGVDGSRDLIVRAANALKRATGCRLGVDIRLDKRLAIGGGLGGGSSDAATTLVALDRLWGLGLGPDRLAAIGLGLGADVPVFVRGRSAWGEGVGEELTPVDLPEPWYLVVVPPCQVCTAEVFAHPGLTRDSLPVKLSDFVRGERRNDCVDVVRRVYAPVSDALDWLGQLDTVGGGRLTGTGACCFAELTDPRIGLAALERLPHGMDGFVARGLNRSPLLDRLSRGP